MKVEKLLNQEGKFKEEALKELQFERDERLQSGSIFKGMSDNDLRELIDSTMNDIEWESLLKITRESWGDSPISEFEVQYELLWETICSKLQNFN
jgi:hypothetical protein